MSRKIKIPTTGMITLAVLALAALAGGIAWLKMSPAATAASAPATAASAPAQTSSPTPSSVARSVPRDTTSAPSTAAAHIPAPAVSQPAQQAQQGQPGQQAFVDPKTGQLRPAEHDEVAALAAAPATRRLARTASAAAPQEFDGPAGSIGIAVPDELQTYTVATKAPDGSVVLEHVTGPKQASALVRANTSKKGPSSHGKEDRNDR
jgi:hypothetical protein